MKAVQNPFYYDGFIAEEQPVPMKKGDALKYYMDACEKKSRAFPCDVELCMCYLHAKDKYETCLRDGSYNETVYVIDRI